MEQLMSYADFENWLVENRKEFPRDARMVILVRRAMVGKRQRLTLMAVPYVTAKSLDGKNTITHFWDRAPVLATLNWQHTPIERLRFDAKKTAFRSLVMKEWRHALPMG